MTSGLVTAILVALLVYALFVVLLRVALRAGGPELLRERWAGPRHLLRCC